MIFCSDLLPNGYNVFLFLEGPISSNNPGAYTRSGPTYDQQSLYSAQEDDDIEYNSRAQAPPQAAAWQVSQQLFQPQQPVSGFGVGRGRGRGRGSQLNQPLRRPNLPGMAAGRRGSAYPGECLKTIMPYQFFLQLIKHQDPSKCWVCKVEYKVNAYDLFEVPDVFIWGLVSP